MSKRYSQKWHQRLFRFLIFFIGVPLAFIIAIWSMVGQPIAYLPPPKFDQVIFTFLGLTASLLLLLLKTGSNIDDNMDVVLGTVERLFRIHSGKDTSVSQVNLMLSEARELMRNERVEIFEAHLEPNAPSGDRILEAHKNIIEEAAKNKYNLTWNIIVGHTKGNKSIWINNLVKELQNKSGNTYHVFELENAEPSLNFLIVRQLNQTYFGMGDWLGPQSTGGVWISNKHTTDAMFTILERLSKLAKPKQ